MGAFAPLLAEGFKGILEDPAFLIGVPLIAVGALGALLTLTPIGIKFPLQGEPAELPAEVAYVSAEGHPGPELYVRVGLLLAALTIFEVAVYYFDLIAGVFIGALLALMLGKFVLVILYFMHLRFDNPLFSRLFTGGLLLAIALFIVVLSTLGASLV